MIGRRVIISMDTSGCFRAPLQNHQAARTTNATPRAPQSRRGRPAPRVALRDRQQQCRQPSGQAGGPEPVDCPRRAARPGGHEQRGDRDDDEREPVVSQKDAVIPGAAAHQQADHHQPVPPPNPASPTARTSRPHSVLWQFLAQESRCRSGRARTRRPATRARTISSASDEVVGRQNRAEQHDDEHRKQHAFLLCRSASRPIRGVAAAAARRFAVTAQLAATVDVFSWRAMIRAPERPRSAARDGQDHQPTVRR